MKCILLGTSGYHPTDRRHTLGVFFPALGLLLDAGSGTYRVARFLETRTLDILLTHAHLDHIQGLTHAFELVFETPLSEIVVHGEAEKLRAIETHLFNPLIFPQKPPLKLVPLQPSLRFGQGVEPTAAPQGTSPAAEVSSPQEPKETPPAQGVTVTHFPLEHPGGAVGYRLDGGGKSLAYVCDTVARDDAPYVEAVRDVDVMIHECYTPDDQAELSARLGHSHTSAVARVARAAGVGRLILVHYSPALTGEDPVDLAAARAIFPRTEMGEDLMVLDW